jgi:hypothetical protein
MLEILCLCPSALVRLRLVPLVYGEVFVPALVDWNHKIAPWIHPESFWNHLSLAR